MFFANFLSETSETISRARQQIVEKRKTECFDCYCFDFGQSDCDIQIFRVFPAQLFVLNLKVLRQAAETLLGTLVIHCVAHFLQLEFNRNDKW